MGEQRLHRGRQVQDFFFSNADRPITIEEIVRETGARGDSVSTMVSRMIQRFPGRMERIGKGLYRWNSEPAEVAPEKPESMKAGSEILMSVLSVREEEFVVSEDNKVKETRYLLRDEETGDLFVMTPFEF